MSACIVLVHLVLTVSSAHIKPFRIDVRSDDQYSCTKHHQSSTQSHGVPHECWRVCLQYLSSPRDLGRFRLISKRHHETHDIMLKLTITDFHCIFTNYSGKRTYRSNKNIERAIPLIPCGAMDLDDEYRFSVSCLWHFHLLSKNDVVRGLDCSSGLSFLSIFLRRDVFSNTDQKEHVLLICICDHYQLADVSLYRYTGQQNDAPSRHFFFDLHDRHLLLEQEYVIINELDDFPIWTMESKWKRLKRIAFGKCIKLSQTVKSNGLRPYRQLQIWVYGNPRHFWTVYWVILSVMFFFLMIGIVESTG